MEQTEFKRPRPQDMFEITDSLSLPDEEIHVSAIRARGAGGQNVNKVSSAIHLRFDIRSSSLPEPCKQRLLDARDRRVNDRGIVVIKAQRFRSQEKNREDALRRLRNLIRAAMIESPKRVATKPSRAARERRLADKARRSRIKELRGKVD